MSDMNYEAGPEFSFDQIEDSSGNQPVEIVSTPEVEGTIIDIDSEPLTSAYDEAADRGIDFERFAEG